MNNNKLLKQLLKGYLDDKGMPGHSVIYRGMQNLTRTYIKRLNKRLIIRFRRKGMTIIVDSTGFSLSNSSKYFDTMKYHQSWIGGMSCAQKTTLFCRD